MDAEPRGHTIDGTPWEEPRPPHLPDRLTSVSPWVLPFLFVLAYQLWLLWIDQPRAGDLGTHVEYWLGTRFRLTGILAVLIGLALFVRHPDARATLPQLASGAFILLLGEVMGLLETTLDPFFVALAPPSDDLSFFSPLKEAYSIFTALVGVFGIAFIASGLSAARRFENVGAVRGLAAVLAIMAICSAGFSMLGLTNLDFDVSPVMVAMIIGSLLVGLFGTLAAAYLVVVSVSGWAGQEEPRSGWRLAAIGAGLMLLPGLLLPGLLSPVIAVAPLSQDVLLGILGVIADGAVIGWVLLVVAFALGLPSSISIPDDEPAGVTRDRPAARTPGSGAD